MLTIWGLAIKSALKKQLQQRFSGRVRFDEPMAAHTAFRVGGPADAFVTATDENELIFLMKWLRENTLPFFIIGGGTNLLVRDQGIRGVVISMTKHLASISRQGLTRISAMAGARLSTLCRFAIRNGLAGLTFALGIPGTVGGAIRMNAGAWQDEIGNVVESLRIVRPDGSIQIMNKEDLRFSYRSLSFVPESGADESDCIILEGIFSLAPGSPQVLTAEADARLNDRKQSQPVSLASAGCFFKNPENRESAGKLIDLAGCKGLRVGDAEVSTAHANFIVNRGRATAEEILRLSHMVQAAVFEKFNVTLTPEVKIVGN